jgi:hypothetical protein
MHLQYLTPNAGQLIMDRVSQPGTPFGPWTGLGITAAWAAVLLAAALVSIRKRDV